MGKKCLGAPCGEPCIFGPFAGPAQPKPGNWRCSWCDPALLKEVLAKPNGKPRMKQHFTNLPASVKNRALCKLPLDLRKEFQQKKEPEPPADEKKSPEEATAKEEAPAGSHRNTRPPNEDDDPIEEDHSASTVKRPRKDT